MKKVLVLVTLFASVAVLTLNAQDVKKEKEKEVVKKEQCNTEKEACCSSDSTATAAKPQQLKKDEGEKEK